jgi:phosphate transport system permease protein
MESANPVQPEIQIDLPELERSLRRPRVLFSFTMSVLTGTATVAAMVPLFSVLYMLIRKGGANLNLSTLTELPPPAMMPGGGVGNAIAGTILIVLIATVISVPIGILGAIYTAEFGPDTTISRVVEFAAKVLTGLPSILAGVFAFAAFVMLTGGFLHWRPVEHSRC